MAEPPFLDTNVILRYITQDDPEQARRAQRVFEQLERGDLSVTTTEGVVVEAVQVLSSKVLYNLPRAAVRTHLSNVLSVRGLVVPHKRAVLRALDVYASTNLDFVDALIVAHMERLKVSTVLSFDKGFDRIGGITRQEP